MARAAVKTGVLASVYVGVNKVLGASKFTISGISAAMLDANEFGYPINKKIPDGTIDPGTISIPDVLKDPDDTTGQALLDAACANSAGYGPDEIKFMRDATSYYTVDTGGLIYVTKGASGGMDRNGLEKTSYEFQISGALLVLKPSLVSIAVTPADETLAPLDTQQYVATGTYSDDSEVVITTLVTWASSEEAYAVITAGGLAACLTDGETDITATLLGITGTTTLTVAT